jgi:hypothetical protein
MVGRELYGGGRWKVTTKAITGFQTKPKAWRCTGEPMAGGGGYAFLVVRRRAHRLDHF